MYCLPDAQIPHPGNQLSFMLHELVFLKGSIQDFLFGGGGGGEVDPEKNFWATRGENKFF